jgi:hypothetical protein
VSRAALGIGWGLVALVGAGMLAFTWETWPHAYVDFGRELYVPWRLAEGEVLYRDIAWFNGPLSAYWNALLFWIFGESLRVLVLANLAAVALLVAVLHALVRRIADRLAAFTACAVFLSLFAFRRIDGVGNDNYLTPYSHELTHGLLLSLLLLQAFAVWRDAPLRRAAATGGLLGGVALTKPEIFVAAAASLACAVALELYRERGSGPTAGRAVALTAVFGAALLAPGILSTALLALAMPWQDALRGTLGAWPAIARSGITSQYFYRATLGLVGFGENSARLLQWTLAYGGAALPITLAALRIRPAPGSANFTSAGWLTFGGVFAAAVVAVLYAGDAFGGSWPEITRPLPVALAVLATGSALLAARERGPGDPVLRTALLVFATVLLAKVAFRVRLDQYGFALAMPGSLLVVTAIVCWLPRWIGRRGGDMGIARAAFLGVLAGVVLALLPIIAATTLERRARLGSGGDAFFSDAATAAVISVVLSELEDRPAQETLAVLPEGVMLNYLARRRNPTGHVNFMPPELLIFGEAEILAAFREDPPDWIALTHKDTREYGVGFFGRGYGRDLYAWVRDHYEPVKQVGDAPLEPASRFGVALLARRDLSR